MSRLHCTRLMILAGALFAASVACAQGYPNKPIRVIVPFAAGSIVDISGRLISQKFNENTGQQMIVENQPGANAIIGTETVGKAAPNGYTLLMATAGSHGLNSSLFTKLPYDPVKDFTPITQALAAYYFLLGGNHVKAGSVSELVALAKANPGKLTLGYAASVTQLTAEMLKLAAGIDITLVPYKTESQALIDLRGGQVDIMFVPTAAALPQIKAGNARVLAVPSAKRSSLLPDVPTVAESGYPGFEASAWIAYMGPAGTPKDIVAKLNTEIVRALQNREIREKLQASGLEIIAGTPEQLGEAVQMEIAKWAKVFRDSKLPRSN